MRGDYLMASADVLYRRLVQVLAWEPDAPRTLEGFREQILSHGVAQAMCAREPEVGGRPCTFGNYFTIVFGENLDGKKPRAKIVPSRGEKR